LHKDSSCSYKCNSKDKQGGAKIAYGDFRGVRRGFGKAELASPFLNNTLNSTYPQERRKLSYGRIFVYFFKQKI